MMITSIRKSRQKVIGLKTFFVYESLDVTTKKRRLFYIQEQRRCQTTEGLTSVKYAKVTNSILRLYTIWKEWVWWNSIRLPSNSSLLFEILTCVN